MSRALDELYRRFDGHIPFELITAARLADLRAEGRRPRRARIRIRVIRWKPAGQIDRLAAAMVDLRSRQGSADRRGLLAMGFSEAELDRWGGPAAAEAMARWERRA